MCEGTTFCSEQSYVSRIPGERSDDNDATDIIENKQEEKSQRTCQSSLSRIPSERRDDNDVTDIIENK